MYADLIRRSRTHADCGIDIEKALDPKASWFVDDTVVCQACATREMMVRYRQKEHEDDKPTPGVPLWHEGRTITVRPATAADLRDAKKGKRQKLTRH